MLSCSKQKKAKNDISLSEEKPFILHTKLPREFSLINTYNNHQKILIILEGVKQTLKGLCFRAQKYVESHKPDSRVLRVYRFLLCKMLRSFVSDNLFMGVIFTEELVPIVSGMLSLAMFNENLIAEESLNSYTTNIGCFLRLLFNLFQYVLFKAFIAVKNHDLFDAAWQDEIFFLKKARVRRYVVYHVFGLEDDSRSLQTNTLIGLEAVYDDIRKRFLSSVDPMGEHLVEQEKYLSMIINKYSVSSSVANLQDRAISIDTKGILLFFYWEFFAAVRSYKDLFAPSMYVSARSRLSIMILEQVTQTFSDMNSRVMVFVNYLLTRVERSRISDSASDSAMNKEFSDMAVETNTLFASMFRKIMSYLMLYIGILSPIILNFGEIFMAEQSRQSLIVAKFIALLKNLKPFYDYFAGKELLMTCDRTDDENYAEDDLDKIFCKCILDDNDIIFFKLLSDIPGSFVEITDFNFEASSIYDFECKDTLSKPMQAFRERIKLSVNTYPCDQSSMEERGGDTASLERLRNELLDTTSSLWLGILSGATPDWRLFNNCNQGQEHSHRWTRALALFKKKLFGNDHFLQTLDVLNMENSLNGDIVSKVISLAEAYCDSVLGQPQPDSTTVMPEQAFPACHSMYK